MTGADIFDGLAFSLDMPEGWIAFDLSSPASEVALEAFVKENPWTGAAISSFQSYPNARLAVNQLLGNTMVAMQIPSQGLPLETIGQGMTAQFQLIPGVSDTPVAEPVTLPAGEALHWKLPLEANKAGGGTVKIEESIYLVAGDDNAILIVFVSPGGGVVPDERAIMESLELR